ncbi:MAG: GNAT family N-acetyltransferase [Burkholderiaceae bacterium]
MDATRFDLRELDPACAAEREWVARGMHMTLVEVEGERGGEIWNLDVTRARLGELLDPARHVSQVFLAVADDAAAPGGTRIGGHTILRLDRDDDGRRYGLFSTTYVDPPLRRLGLADRLIARGEACLRAQGMTDAATWTSSTNAKLIALYGKHGYAIDRSGAHGQTGTMMVRLARRLA